MHRMFVAAVPASSDGEALGREAFCSTKGLPALARRTYPLLPMRYGSAVLAAFVSISGSHVFLGLLQCSFLPRQERRIACFPDCVPRLGLDFVMTNDHTE